MKKKKIKKFANEYMKQTKLKMNIDLAYKSC